MKALIIDENFLINALFCILLAGTHYYLKVSLDILMIFRVCLRVISFLEACRCFIPPVLFLTVFNIFRPKRKTLQQRWGSDWVWSRNLAVATSFLGQKNASQTERGLGKIGE